jgi:forkhead transcription factor HCM1
MAPPPQGHFITDSLMKKATGLMPQSHRPLRPVTENIPMYHAAPQYDKENMYIPDMMAPGSGYSQKPMNKPNTPLPPMPLASEKSNKKQKKHSVSDLPQLPFIWPDPSELPLIDDDGAKPAFSYSQLIGMAILRSDNRRLTLAQIYKWISDSFAFYRTQETGWQNSIRHNLSLNKAFTKQDRPKDDPGKGHYWAIQPGFEAQFLRERSKNGNPNPVLSQSAQPKRPSTAQSTSSQSAAKHVDSTKFAEEDELSSDATIPASDPAVHEGLPPGQAMPPPSRNLRSSPPAADIHSSPPPALTMSSMHDRTPPLDGHFAVPSTRSNGGRKRKLSNLQTGLGDSGYYSSIESSAVRNTRTLLTSDADDHPVRKRGRAEEEIARIRSSSYDSPSKNRNPTILVSSPYRADTSAPYTPGVMFKRPMRPPMSVSPNTNLKRHRESVCKLLESPVHSLPTLDPGFDPVLGNIFADIHDPEWIKALEESPIRSTKRPRLERANTTIGIFADITAFGVDTRRYLSPAKLASSPLRLGSPVKLPAATLLNDKAFLAKQVESTGNDENDDFAFALNLPSDDSEQIDLTQGFHRIGSPSTLVPTNVMAPPQNFAFPVYPGTEQTYPSPSKQGRSKPELSRRSTYNL